MGTTQANAPRVVRALARILLLSLLAGLFVAPGPALGAWPGSNGRIAFTAIDGLDGAIYVGRSGSTGDPVRPFGSLASTGPPSWSAQGSLAMDSGGDIYYAHPSANAFAGDGGVVPIQLALPGYDFSPSWSPDGTKIVYSKDPEEAEGEPQVAGSDIWVYDFTTEMESLLALGGPVDEEPVWSPSGQHVVFQTIDPDALLPQYDLLFVDTATGQVNPLTAGGGDELSADFSPDGSRLAFQTGTGISVADWGDMPGAEELIPGGTMPAWSPDGKSIAYVTADGSEVRRFDLASGISFPISQTWTLAGGETTLAYPDWEPVRLQPDGMIKSPRTASYRGNGVYNTSGARQTRLVKAKRGTNRTFYVRVQNDGELSDGFVLKGCGNSRGFKITYWRGSSGRRGITKAMKAGSYRKTLAPGAATSLRVTIAVGDRARIRSVKTCSVTAISLGDRRRKDVVKAKVKVIRG